MSTRRFLLLVLALAVAGGLGIGWLVLTRPVPVRPAPVRVNPEGAVTLTLGSAEAPIEVWEGSDYQCPDCARYELLVMPDIKARFIQTGRVRWRYLLFALPGHAEAVPATHAVACAQEQGEGEALAMHDGLFRRLAEWSRSAEHLAIFRILAVEVGLNSTDWDECMASERHMVAVEQSWREAQRVGIPGTPTVLLFDRFYVGGLTANQLERVLTADPDR